jgi:hypothetical protein
MRQTDGHVKHVETNRNAYWGLVRKLERNRSEDLWVDGRIILKWPSSPRRWKLLGLLDPKEESITLLRNKDKQEMTGQMMWIIKYVLWSNHTEHYLMAIRLAYDMTQPFVLNGTSHGGDDTITMCPRLADTMRWRPSMLYRLPLSRHRCMICHRRRNYEGLHSAVLGYVSMSHSFCSLSYDRSVASCKASSPQGAI